jgi:hypothetical protein
MIDGFSPSIKGGMADMCIVQTEVDFRLPEKLLASDPPIVIEAISEGNSGRDDGLTQLFDWILYLGIWMVVGYDLEIEFGNRFWSFMR